MGRVADFFRRAGMAAYFVSEDPVWHQNSCLGVIFLGETTIAPLETPNSGGARERKTASIKKLETHYVRTSELTDRNNFHLCKESSLSSGNESIEVSVSEPA